MRRRVRGIMMCHVRYEDTCRSYFTVTGSQGPFTHIRLNIFPDGGVARSVALFIIQRTRQTDTAHFEVDSD